MGANFDVTAILKANVSDFTSGLKEAQMSLKSLREQTGSSLDKISQSLSTFGGSMMRVGSGMTATFTAPVVGAIGGVVKSFAELEQNIGGTEAVFGQFAKTVQNDATVAYQKMGLSASDYMATANKMASLFQGSGVSQQRSLELTSDAMQRASDVASVMGVDMSMAMESIAGAAKGNYTMMDNLGVAMNATTLEAYALEKGVNFKWDTASNAEKAELAMKMFMDRTSQYAGNFEKEAKSSVAGSFDAMRGAFENLTAGLGQKDADMKSLLANMGNTIKVFVENVKGVVKNIWDNLPLAPWQKWLGAILVAGGPIIAVIGGIVFAISKIVGAVKMAGTAFTAIKTTLAALSGALAGISAPVLAVVGFIAALVAGFIYLYNTNEEFRAKVQEVWSQVEKVISTVVQTVVDFVMSVWGGLVSWWEANQETIMTTVSTVWNSIVGTITTVVQTVFDFLVQIWTTISTWWTENQELIRSTAETVWTFISKFVTIAVNIISTVIQAVMTFLGPYLQTAWDNIKLIIETVWNFIKIIVETALNVILGIIETIMNIINGNWSAAWESIKGVFSAIWDGIKAVVELAFGFVRDFISNTLSGIQATWDSIWSSVSNFLSSTWDTIKSTVSTAIDNVKSTISDGWNTVVETVTTACDNVVEAVKTGFDNAINGAKSFISNAVSVGADLISGFVEGVKSAAGRLIDAVGGAVSGAIDWAKGLLGINSPSRVFRQFGIYTDQGFVIGINTGAGKVMKSMKNMAQGAISAFTGQDVAGSLQSELGAVDGELGRLTAYDPSVSFNGGTLTVGQQAADIVLKMGNAVYRAFTDDITHAQELELVLDNY